ncbi:uncharacterized protein LAESUDRAFT_662670 [Laetiporus sulphureus 93-53]|uniref:AhpC-TSA-domain-containing protein n=1 Tax=Laetiporus sulphureus 93-53 TaxID=1314785 RepID=A0A165C271_9APHY|nr:uncharacterized protein LAESUDRAFT_662670 [Laetiporus sulphureus 93-53]KZT02065.1 hypothetical protein LAESUDRAFT_662670 [Laetiporus sulphureus 93-53]
MTLPDDKTVREASKVTVYDASGNPVEFGSLFRGQKTIVVFIRHFFCGVCQYVAQLATVRSDALEQAGVRLVVIGCGDWQPIKSYCENTGYKGDLYADPSRVLHQLLALAESLERTPAGQEKRTYLGKSFIGNVVKSIWDGPFKNPQLIGKQGNISQLGGDFIFGPGETCSFASRMKHTEDHIDVADLMHEAGVSYP